MKIEDSPIDAELSPAKVRGVGDGCVLWMMKSWLNENGAPPKSIHQSSNAAFTTAVYPVERAG
jgi:hypothetical protein